MQTTKYLTAHYRYALMICSRAGEKNWIRISEPNQPKKLDSKHNKNLDLFYWILNSYTRKSEPKNILIFYLNTQTFTLKCEYLPENMGIYPIIY